MKKNKTKVLVVGGAGYVGSRLVPLLLAQGYMVNVLDLYIYGKNVFSGHSKNPNFKEFIGDIRNPEVVKKALRGCNVIIHLACISNDPSFELDPDLGKSVNYESFQPLVRAAKDAGVERFIYASSSSVYGVRSEPNVHEGLELKPITDYSKYKAMCEEVLLGEREPGFSTLVLRPATVCGYAPRLRLDLTVNILTSHAFHNGVMTVFGGEQLRPNINIKDIVNLYISVIEAPDDKVDGQVFNVGYENYSVMEIAEIVREATDTNARIEITKTDDLRSYHISSEKIKSTLGFQPGHDISDAVLSLIDVFEKKLAPQVMTNPLFYNVKRMQELGLV